MEDLFEFGLCNKDETIIRICAILSVIYFFTKMLDKIKELCRQTFYQRHLLERGNVFDRTGCITGR